MNSTGFLNRSYDDLNKTDLDAFFIAFKKQVKSVIIESSDIINFITSELLLRPSTKINNLKLKIWFSCSILENYPEFQLHFNENDNDEQRVNANDFIYVYSLLLHYSCVRYADQKMQHICSGLADKNQTFIAKFLECLIGKNTSYTRASIQEAIEEAGKLKKFNS